MRLARTVLVVFLFWLPLGSWGRSDFDEASAEQVLELASALSSKLEPAVENAIRNSIEYVIWSLEERRNPSSHRALAKLVSIRLGESSIRDRDCAILKRGVRMLEPLRSTEVIARWCTAKAVEMNFKVDQVCLGQTDIKQSAGLLVAAIKSGRQCDR